MTKVKKKELPSKGSFVIQIETPDNGRRWTGPGTDWLVSSEEKAQVYKTLAGAARWIEKSARAQGECEIVEVTK